MICWYNLKIYNVIFVFCYKDTQFNACFNRIEVDGPLKRSPCFQVNDVLHFKPIPIIYRTSLFQNFLKVIKIGKERGNSY